MAWEDHRWPIRQQASFGNSLRLYQAFRAEAVGEQFPQRKSPFLPSAVEAEDFQIRGKFPHHLAANAAGCAKVLPFSRYHNPTETGLPFRHRVGDGVPLGADPCRVRRVLHIATGVNRAVFTLYRRPHRKVGLGAVGPIQHGNGGGFQFFSGHGHSSISRTCSTGTVSEPAVPLFIGSVS